MAIKSELTAISTRYKSKKVIKVLRYEEGLEDGFVKRYAKKNHSGPDSILLFPYSDDDKEIMVPYVTIDDKQILWGKNHVLIFDDDKDTVYSIPEVELRDKFVRADAKAKEPDEEKAKEVAQETV